MPVSVPFYWEESSTCTCHGGLTRSRLDTRLGRSLCFAVMNQAAQSLITSLFVDAQFSFIWGLMSVSGNAKFKERVHAYRLNTF